MHPELAKAMIKRVRQRVSDGDYPTTHPESVEALEDLVLCLANQSAWPFESSLTEPQPPGSTSAPRWSSTPNDEAADEPRPSPSTPNDE